MSDPAQDDNTNPDVDSLASLTTESHTIVCDAELDDDFFVCRKCNKVFKDLSEYLEHKIKDENYKLSHTRSKVYKRMVIPQLVEKKKCIPKKDEHTNDSQDSNNIVTSGGLGEVDPDLNEDKNKGSCDEGSTSKDKGTVKRARKRKVYSHVSEQQLSSLEKENSCHLCDQKFRRAATLRWHIKYDHKDKEDNSEESDTTADEMVKADLDKDFQPKVGDENEELNDDEIDPDIQRASISKMTVLSAGRNKKEDISKGDDGNDQRPYVCDICGRGFKELPVYKAHAIVHSKERNFVCTVEGCPYGFKTKGCLVRHMRRHTGERPYTCGKCGRAFAESGALNRHMKARRNCAQTPDTHYPRYKKKWSYHPNIEAVVDELKRDVCIASQESLNTKYYIHSDVVPFDGDKAMTETGDLTPTSLASDRTEIVISDVLTAGELQSSSETVASLNKHIEAMSESSVATDSGVKPVELLAEANCQVCNKEFQNIEHLEAHLRTHLADQPTHCGLCHFLAQNRDEMRQHVLTMHTESLNDIESTLLSLEQLDPAKNVSQQKDERTTLRDALKAIKQLHKLKASTSTEKPVGSTRNPSTSGSLQCMICNRTFKGVNYMRQHMRMHTGDRPFKCSQCNRSFTSKDVLKKHMWVHMNQRDYKCGECGKMFKRLVHVQQHIKTHSQERMFRCSICEKLFKTHNSLKVHLRTHTNINPYRCQVCNRHFRERGSLQRHMRLHTGERPYVCPHCNRGFAEQGTLSRHLRAKVPCSATRDANVQLAPPNNTMLAQFSSMVADTQYILPSVNNEELTAGNLIVLKTEHGGSEEVVDNIEIVTQDVTLDDKLQSDGIITTEAVDEMMEGNNTETLQVYDTTTGESFIITGDKSVIKSQQIALESIDGELSLEKIKDFLMASGGQNVAVASTEGLIVEEDEVGSIIVKEEDVRTEEIQDIVITSDKLEIDGNVNHENVQVTELGAEVITILSSQDNTEPLSL